MSVQRRTVRRPLLDEMVVNHEVRRQLACRIDRLVSYDNVTCAVVKYPYYASVLHRAASKVAHAAVGALAEEVSALKMWQGNADLLNLADGRHLPYIIVYKFGNVHGNVSAVTLGPAFLPQIAGYLGHLVYFLLKSGTSVKYTFHIVHSFMLQRYEKI